MTKWVYSFGAGKAEGSAEMRTLLGGKGANLAEMSNLGLPVPRGFTIRTEVCTYLNGNNRHYPDVDLPRFDSGSATHSKRPFVRWPRGFPLPKLNGVYADCRSR